MRLLQRTFDVTTRFGGNFVQEIDGVSGGREDGRRVDWFYYVNGIESSTGAGERKLHRGDRVWWDHHDWETAMRVPAVVGAFPEPFRSGQDGKKLPIRLVCAGAEEPLVRRGREAPERRGRAQRRALEPRVLARRGAADPRRQVVRRAQGHRVAPARGRPGGLRRVRQAVAGGQLDRADGRRRQDRADARAGRWAGRGDVLPGGAPDLADHGHRRRRRRGGRGRADEDQLRFHFALAIDAGRGVPLRSRRP